MSTSDNSVLEQNETYADREWILRYDTPIRKRIYDHLQGDENKDFGTTIEHPYRIVRPVLSNPSLGHGWYKLNPRIIGHPLAIMKIDKVMDKIAFKPYTFYYRDLPSANIQHAIEIAKSIIMCKFAIKIDRIYIDTHNKLVYMYYEDGNYVYLDTDSINLDKFNNCKPVFSSDIACNKLRNVVVDKFNVKNKIKLIDNVYTVDMSFSDMIIDDMNNLLSAMVANGYYTLKGDRYRELASEFDINRVIEYKKPVYRSLIINRDKLRKMGREKIPYMTTQSSYGDDYEFILYNAVKLQPTDVMTRILSDGAVRLGVNDIDELKEFEKELKKKMKVKLDLVSFASDSLEELNEMNKQDYDDNGVIGIIGDKWYLVTEI